MYGIVTAKTMIISDLACLLDQPVIDDDRVDLRPQSFDTAMHLLRVAVVESAAADGCCCRGPELNIGDGD